MSGPKRETGGILAHPLNWSALHSFDEFAGFDLYSRLGKA
jgi:hypothetical protein